MAYNFNNAEEARLYRQNELRQTALKKKPSKPAATKKPAATPTKATNPGTTAAVKPPPVAAKPVDPNTGKPTDQIMLENAARDAQKAAEALAAQQEEYTRKQQDKLLADRTEGANKQYDITAADLATRLAQMKLEREGRLNTGIADLRQNVDNDALRRGIARSSVPLTMSKEGEEKLRLASGQDIANLDSAAASDLARAALARDTTINQGQAAYQDVMGQSELDKARTLTESQTKLGGTLAEIAAKYAALQRQNAANRGGGGGGYKVKDTVPDNPFLNTANNLVNNNLISNNQRRSNDPWANTDFRDYLWRNHGISNPGQYNPTRRY